MKILKNFICILLVASFLMATAMPIGAARVTYYLSDLKLAEADTEQEAKNLLAKAGYTVFDKNLNPGGDTVVYLGYKKTTNVEEAITDVRVMNMNGGFNVTNYEAIKDEALDEYNSTIDQIRIAAKEFAENYKAGKREALLAYRQLNYYYVENNSVKTKMGDYMLNFPETDESFADILFKGNPTILNNIRSLLAMGVSDGGALIERIKAAVNDESVYGNKEYWEDAKALVNKTVQLKKLFSDTKAEIDEIKADTTMTETEKEISLVMPTYNLTLLMAFDEVLKSIPYGEGSNYSEYFDKSAVTDYSVLYPFVDAMTPGQKAMALAGQLHAVLVYNCVEMSDEDIENEFNKIEEDSEPLSVYLGTNMDILEGAIGVTSDAIREEASTGRPWYDCVTGDPTAAIDIITFFGVGGLSLVGVSAYFLKESIGTTTTTNLGLLEGSNLKATINKMLDDSIDDLADISMDTSASHQIHATVTTTTSTNVVGVVFSSLGLALGIAMLAFSIYNIVQLVNKYNVEYTEIPVNMINTVSTANGNRYVNYQVVSSLYVEDGKTVEKAGDTNGYNGEKWNAIYYTKSYEAGKCMTANAYILENAADFGKYTPVAKFGAKVCYDLNSYNGNSSKDSIYIAFGNSNNKKSAETSVPTVVGSVFTYGATAISAIAGVLIGMGAMALIIRKKEENVKEKKNENS